MTTTAGPPVKVDDNQDPLPEASWLWRRLFTFVVTAIIMCFIWIGIDRLSQVAILRPQKGIPALADLLRYLLIFNWVMVTYYMIAPSAEQIVKMFQTASMFRHGVQFAARSTAQGPDGAAETVTTAGRPLPPTPGTPPNQGGSGQKPGGYQPKPAPEVTSEATEILE